MKVIIDRFEGDFAVCEKENRQMINIEKSILPDLVKEGDVLSIKNEIITIDTAATVKRKKEIEQLTNDLWT